MSRLMSRQNSFALGRKTGDAGNAPKSKGNDTKGIEAEAAAGRHIEQCEFRQVFQSGTLLIPSQYC